MTTLGTMGRNNGSFDRKTEESLRRLHQVNDGTQIFSRHGLLLAA